MVLSFSFASPGNGKVHESRHQGTESRMQTGGDGLIGNVLRLGCEGLRVEESEASSDHRA